MSAEPASPSTTYRRPVSLRNAREKPRASMTDLFLRGLNGAMPCGEGDQIENIIPALTPNRCRNFQLYCTCEPRNPEWETSVGDKCGRQVGDKCKLSPKNPEWETSVGDKSGRQVWETSVGDKWETSVNSCAPRHPEWEIRVGDKWETSVKSCGPRHPE